VQVIIFLTLYLLYAMVWINKAQQWVDSQSYKCKYIYNSFCCLILLLDNNFFYSITIVCYGLNSLSSTVNGSIA
jgi:hypothetical protein